MKGIVSILVLLAESAPAFAQGEPPQDKYADHLGVGDGALQVTGAVKVEEWWDDNITLSPDNETDDFITVLIPELKLRHEGARHDLRLSYVGRDLIYTDNSDFNGMEHYLDLLGRFQSSNLRGELGAEYKLRREPFDAVQFTGRFTSHGARAWFTGAADFNMVDVEITGEFASFDASGSDFDHYDFGRAGISGLVAFDAMPKTQVYFEIAFSSTDYDEDQVLNDFNQFRASLGLRGEPTAKLTMNARLGFSLADPESGAVNPSDDVTGLDASVTATWKMDEISSLLVEIVHRPSESSFSGLQKLTRLRTVYDREVAERLTVTLELAAEWQDESEIEVDRSGIDGRASLTYVPGTHLKFDFGLQLRSKNSDDPTLEYDNFRGWLGARVDW